MCTLPPPAKSPILPPATQTKVPDIELVVASSTHRSSPHRACKFPSSASFVKQASPRNNFVSEKCRQTNKLGPHSASSVGGSEVRAHNLQRDELLAIETQREGGAWWAMDASITSVNVQQEVWLIGSHAITVS
jgi:hypothetical protein